MTEDALRAQDEAYLASLPKPKPKPIPAPPQEPVKVKDLPPKLTPEEERLREKWSRLIDLISRGKVDPLKSFWTREEPTFGGIDVRIPDWAEGKGGTLLQLAAQAGQEEATRWLLEEAHADPTVDVPIDHIQIIPPNGEQSDDEDQRSPAGSRRTAYDIASTRAVRNVFRRSAALYPDRWDWLGGETGARVPSVLTKEMEEGRDEKKKVRRKGLKDKIKEREAKENARGVSRSPSPAPEPPRQAVRETASAGPRKLGGASGSTEGVTGLTPDMRARIERERRARAAEARMAALSGKR